MMQTIKFARIRATSDPDRDENRGGTYYGLNFSHRIPRLVLSVERLANNRMFYRAPVKR
jgi:hypothetical protein